MPDKPILFSGSMVRAILEDRKDLTRRVCKIQPDFEADGCISAGLENPPVWFDFWNMDGRRMRVKAPYWPGDTLWVRETWRRAKEGLPDGIEYRADNLLVWFDGNEPQKAREDIQRFPRDGKWRPSIFMPRWASRLSLSVLSVRAERLQEITEEEAIREGIEQMVFEWETRTDVLTYRSSFVNLWDSINGKTHPWASNSFVWVIEFRKVNLPELPDS